ncbi:putative endonuclease/exonuclease/phosphatase protein [Roseibium sp. TrichSKD4]|nr:putative endonuclease/exonuclease/phosphatase protein [Roseibium sp. TrichSKD4]
MTAQNCRPVASNTLKGPLVLEKWAVMWTGLLLPRFRRVELTHGAAAALLLRSEVFSVNESGLIAATRKLRQIERDL